MTSLLKTGVNHRIPADMRQVLEHDTALQDIWNNLTPLGRNEWICWVTIVKQEKTREAHLIRLDEDLKRGKRRPCCWPGCPHRKPEAAKWFTKRP